MEMDQTEAHIPGFYPVRLKKDKRDARLTRPIDL